MTILHYCPGYLAQGVYNRSIMYVGKHAHKV